MTTRPARPVRIGVVELLERLAISRVTLRRWMRGAGVSTPLPACHRLGQRRVWWLHEIERWEQARMQETPSRRMPPKPRAA